MKKYSRQFAGNTETFFEKLKAVTESSTESSTWCDKKCFVLRIKSNGRFTLFYHRPFFRNSFALLLFGKATQTPDGVTVTANLRMALFEK